MRDHLEKLSEATAAKRAAAAEWRDAIRDAAAAGVPQRAIAVAAGVSAARISQILASLSS